MKIVGMMSVRDEADLLPQVYPHIRNQVDLLYVYEDGSQDNTWNIVKDADYAIRRVDDKNRPEIYRPNYHHLLERMKKDFGDEEVWVFITMGDRFFLNKYPAQIVREAQAEGCSAVEGIQLDFLRHRVDPWTKENDPWPDLSNIRSICRWFKFDERCTVAFKLHPQLSYLKSKYPWPRNVPDDMKVQYAARAMNHQLSLEMPYLEHQGRRTPKAAMWRINSGSRPRSDKKHLHHNFSSYEAVLDTNPGFYLPYKLLPWIDNNSLDALVYMNNVEDLTQSNRRYFYLGIEHMVKRFPLFPRRDL